ncbi:MAG: class I adenylate-forming enzyme family protein [Paracoccaceae bacterium]
MADSPRESLLDAGPRPVCPAAFNIAAHVLAPAARTPDKPALEILGGAGAEVWTYAEIDRAVRGLASALKAAGLAPGERVAITLGSGVAFPLVFFATIAAGGVAVPLSSQLTAPEVARLLARLSPRLVAGPVAREALPPGATAIAPPEIEAMRAETPGAVAATRADDPAFVVFTSGTSGTPRGVVHAQRSAFARRMMWTGWYGLSAGDRVLHAGAFNWTYTLGAGLTDPWAAGATALVYQGARDPFVWPRLARDHEATIFAAVPGVYRQMLRSDEDLGAAFARLRHGLSAGERLVDALRAEWRERTGRDLHEALGMSEISTFVSGSPGRPAPAGTTGYPQPGRRVAVLAEDDARPVPRGTPGRLAVDARDPGLMLGYLDDPAADAETRAGAWFLTGDRAVMHADGAIEHLGRGDDVMNALGYRVSPQEVEEAMAGCPGVAEIAVAELPVRADLALVAAFVVPAGDEAPDEAALAAWAAERLAAYKRPRLWRTVAALPRTANGKLIRRTLVEAHRTARD